MPRIGSLQGRWWGFVFPLTAILVVFADQLSKSWIREHLGPGESLGEVGFFRFTHIYNSGAAFGLFPGQSFLLTIVALVGVVALLLYAFFFHHRFPFLYNWPGRLALGLVLGGTVGNLIDRIRLGHVTDFINFNLWPAFNLADSAIVVGMIIIAYLLISLVFTRKPPDGKGI